MDLNGRRFLLLLQDITRQQQLAALERVFFHEMSNLVTGLGTFSTKLFGEQILKGMVQFMSSPAEGTVFELRLPK